ncbi:hypothetical protein GLP02_24820, partial [Escherichia coli]|nr:hypothetical protein [Escherichia coli]
MVDRVSQWRDIYEGIEGSGVKEAAKAVVSARTAQQMSVCGEHEYSNNVTAHSDGLLAKVGMGMGSVVAGLFHSGRDTIETVLN